MIGSGSGKIYYYENTGTDKKWEFKLVNDDFMPARGRENSAPLLIDLDQDGDLDLLVGSKSGRLYYYSNQGSGEEARFVQDTNLFNNLWLGQNSRPAVADLDGDGLLDLLVGTFDGKLIYIHNDSSRFSIVRRDYQNIDVNLGSSPFFADLGNNDQPDLLIGSDEGKVYFLRNQKADFQGNWDPIPKIADALSFPRGSNPVAYDIDADGDLDLIIGSDAGTIFLYKNDAIVREVTNTGESELLTNY